MDSAKLRELLAKSTPGPWSTYAGEAVDADGVQLFGIMRDSEEADSTLTAAMHEALPALLDELDALRALRARVEAAPVGWAVAWWEPHGYTPGWRTAEMESREDALKMAAFWDKHDGEWLRPHRVARMVIDDVTEEETQKWADFWADVRLLAADAGEVAGG